VVTEPSTYKDFVGIQPMEVVELSAYPSKDI